MTHAPGMPPPVDAPGAATGFAPGDPSRRDGSVSHLDVPSLAGRVFVPGLGEVDPVRFRATNTRLEGLLGHLSSGHSRLPLGGAARARIDAQLASMHESDELTRIQYEALRAGLDALGALGRTLLDLQTAGLTIRPDHYSQRRPQ